MGYHLDASYSLLDNFKLLGHNDNSLNLAFRYKFVDYNAGSFEQTETNIFDQTNTPRTGLTLHLGEKTVLKANYSYLFKKDILGNPTKTGDIQFGLATYF